MPFITIGSKRPPGGFNLFVRLKKNDQKSSWLITFFFLGGVENHKSGVFWIYTTGQEKKGVHGG